MIRAPPAIAGFEPENIVVLWTAKCLFEVKKRYSGHLLPHLAVQGLLKLQLKSVARQLILISLLYACFDRYMLDTLHPLLPPSASA